MSTDLYTHDVFLSHSSKDKAVVRTIAERLRADGLRVWFDDWELKPGDSISTKIEQGLEQSRVLVLCLSANAFASDWAQLESRTFRFRDPLNKYRRFIPLRLDDAPIKGSLAQFLYINWLLEDREQEYTKLLEACRPSANPKAAKAEAAQEQAEELAFQLNSSECFNTYAFSPDRKRALTGSDCTVRLWDIETGRCLRVLKGHTGLVSNVAWSIDQRRVLSCSLDQTVRLWDVETECCLRVFKGHTGFVVRVAWSADQRRALSCSSDKTVRLWDVKTGCCLRVLEGHTSVVNDVAWNIDQRHAISCSFDKTIRLWDVETGCCLRVLKGHTSIVKNVAWSVDQRRALSGSEDCTMRLWDLETGRCLRMFEGHTGTVLSLALSANQCHALSSSSDTTLRLWNLETGHCLCVLEGHINKINSVAWNVNQRYALSGDCYGEIRIWDLSEFVTEARAPVAPTPEQVQYTNAKVLLVGDSGVGKTGLSNYLALNIKDEERNTSTDGAWATQWTLPHSVNQDGVEREIWLWDFAGQVDYRLVHQLYMDDTAAAVLVFNPQHENPFEGLGQWDSDLQKASRRPYAKLLAAGRIDRGGLVVSGASMDKFMAERSFHSSLQLTSAKTGEGCDELRAAIIEAIDW
jgi:small GTP-binding protein